jgi:hypothetical protein
VLKGERAPAIVAEYKAMLEYSEKMTREKQKLDEQMKVLAAQQSMASSPALDDAILENAKGRGIAMAASILLKHVRTPRMGFIDTARLPDGVLEAIDEMVVEMSKREHSFQALTNGDSK